MAKSRQIFACRACGAIQTKWMGKCPDCGTWDALEAERVEPKAKVDPRGASLAAWGASGGSGGGGGGGGGGDAGAEPNADSALGVRHSAPSASAPSPGARPIGQIETQASMKRIATGLSELDRVLGGGLVPGSAVLLGGDPGIGKSTILLQAAASLAKTGTRVLYVSSEESAEQVKLRATRLGANEQSDLFLLAETSLARITEQAARVLGDCPEGTPPVLVIDSIQMIYKADLDAFPGSLTQLRRCAAELAYFAKASGVTVILVGHVTKDGVLAGPRLLEHLVDAVLYFEGDRYHAHRVVRAVKNRFGNTLEIGLFEMTGTGLRQAPEGAGLVALPEMNVARSGSVVCPVLTGTRCLLVELQALTATGFPGATKRKSSGVDSNRLAMLIAVLEQHAGLRLADRDVFAQAVGGIRVTEPAADLALLLAIAGAHFRKGVAPRTVAIGEVGLGGEVRPVAQIEQRVREAERLGFVRALVPMIGSKNVIAAGEKRNPSDAGTRKGIELVPVRSISQAIEELDPMPAHPSLTPTSVTTARRAASPATKHPGFTLVELLVVIAIISLLMGIVLPSLKHARDTAKTMHCSVNLRSIGQALQMYADENEEWYPYTTGWQVWEGDGTGDDQPGLGWTEILHPYLTSQEVYVDKSRPPDNPFAYFLQARYPLALANRSGVPRVPGQPLAVRLPLIFWTTQFVVAGDNNTPVQYPEPYGIALLRPDCDMDDGETDCAFPSIEPLKPHNGLCNLLFADGHVDAYRRYEQGKITWDGREMRSWGETQ